jgi:hypothetical protein
MSAIIPFLRDGSFDPRDIQSMSLALEHVCAALGVNGDTKARQEIAARIIEHASRGELNWVSLRDRVLRETNSHEAKI